MDSLRAGTGRLEGFGDQDQVGNRAWPGSQENRWNGEGVRKEEFDAAPCPLLPRSSSGGKVSLSLRSRTFDCKAIDSIIISFALQEWSKRLKKPVEVREGMEEVMEKENQNPQEFCKCTPKKRNYESDDANDDKDEL